MKPHGQDGHTWRSLSQALKGRGRWGGSGLHWTQKPTVASVDGAQQGQIPRVLAWPPSAAGRIMDQLKPLSYSQRQGHLRHGSLTQVGLTGREPPTTGGPTFPGRSSAGEQATLMRRGAPTLCSCCGRKRSPAGPGQKPTWPNFTHLSGQRGEALRAPKVSPEMVLFN